MSACPYSPDAGRARFRKSVIADARQRPEDKACLFDNLLDPPLVWALGRNNIPSGTQVHPVKANLPFDPKPDQARPLRVPVILCRQPSIHRDQAHRASAFALEGLVDVELGKAGGWGFCRGRRPISRRSGMLKPLPGNSLSS